MIWLSEPSNSGEREAGSFATSKNSGIQDA